MMGKKKWENIVDCTKVIWPTRVLAVLMLLAGIATLVCSAPGIFRIGAPAVEAAPQRKTTQRPPVTVGADSTTPTSTDMQAFQKRAAEADLKYVDLKAQLEYNAKNAEN